MRAEGPKRHRLHVARWDSACSRFAGAETAVSSRVREPPVSDVHAEPGVDDALRLQALGREFGTVVDCALLQHVRCDERPEYLAASPP